MGESDICVGNFCFFNFKEAEGVLVIGEVGSFYFGESVVDSKLG
ncbi:hypothetical protein O53_1180 [Microcystis aeruginosa TAIHU98]|uniref:Uncharacterized protein n=1 Tax=Microcystis aeruginosa TAIHU98 TaxID=1134457 RepID=L7EE75_MICAE|nr:hypothetical protein O53_1180 [Microcystis aeruginosa TAIHU98]